MSVKYNYSNIRIALIGCGNWGKNHARVFHELGALYAVCDIESSKAMAFSEKYAVPSMALEQILDSSEIDAVVITTPSRTHDALIHQSLAANKHVFVEKPFTLSTEAASRLGEFAAKQGRILMIGHLLQYHEGFATVKSLKTPDVLGNLRYISSHRCSFGKFPGETSVLWDFAPHDVSMILSLVGKMPYRVHASGGNYLDHTHLDMACLHLDFEGNIQAKIYVSWLHPLKEQKLTVIGDRGMLIFDDCQPWENKLTFYPHPSAWQDGLPHPFVPQPANVPLEKSEPLTNECKHFLEALFTQTQPLTNAVEATRVTRVLEAAVKSLKTQLPVEFEPAPASKKHQLTSETL